MRVAPVRVPPMRVGPGSVAPLKVGPLKVAPGGGGGGGRSEGALNEYDPDLSRAFLVQGRRWEVVSPPKQERKAVPLTSLPPQVRGTQLGLPHPR